jgi:hypothetical protein
VVGISLSDGGANQTCHFPGIYTSASINSSALAECRDGLPNSVEIQGKEVKLMTKTSDSNDSPDQSEHAPRRARLPGFITDDKIGLGDVIKRATSYVGIKPCGGCERRAAALNRWVVFKGRAQVTRVHKSIL